MKKRIFKNSGKPFSTRGHSVRLTSVNTFPFHFVLYFLFSFLLSHTFLIATPIRICIFTRFRFPSPAFASASVSRQLSRSILLALALIVFRASFPSNPFSLPHSHSYSVSSLFFTPPLLRFSRNYFYPRLWCKFLLFSLPPPFLVALCLPISLATSSRRLFNSIRFTSLRAIPTTPAIHSRFIVETRVSSLCALPEHQVLRPKFSRRKLLVSLLPPISLNPRLLSEERTLSFFFSCFYSWELLSLFRLVSERNKAVWSLKQFVCHIFVCHIFIITNYPDAYSWKKSRSELCVKSVAWLNTNMCYCPLNIWLYADLHYWSSNWQSICLPALLS